MELRQVQTFLAVAEELHFGRAAERLNMTQPAVSQQIRALEKDVGVRLLHRNTRAVSLTAAGQSFLEPAYRLLEASRIAQRAVHLEPSEVIGNVSIGFAGTCASKAIPRLARAVRARLPGVELELRGQIYSGVASAMVRRKQLDIGFSRLPVTEDQVDYRVYEMESVVLALPADHPLASQRAVRLEDLSDEQFVTYPSTGGVRVREALMKVGEAAGFRPNVIQEAPDSYSILSLVAAGVGISITEASVQHISIPGLVYRSLLPEPAPIPAILTWHSEQATPATRAVLALAEETLPTPDDAPHPRRDVASRGTAHEDMPAAPR
ncbi:LysR family transcriptional regulator [Rhodococcus koreensis]